MAFQDKIKLVIEVVKDGASQALAGLKGDLAATDGALGKTQSTAGSAFGAIKEHAGAMALGAGAALVGFGVKAVGAFTDLALEADHFRGQSGLALDEASRWIAVGDDIGVSGDTIAGAFNKANIAIGSGKPLLAEYGIEVKKTKEGLVDTNATMLNAIEVIKGVQDPTKKAELAAATFGKSWTDMSELIEMGADDITAAMGEVSDAQIIDDSEVGKAKQYRESMDNLKDSISDVAITAGEELTPAISAAADMLSTIAPAVGSVVGAVGDAFVGMTDAAYAFGAGVADMVDALPFVDLVEPIGPTLYEWKKLEQGTADLVAEFSKGSPTISDFRARVEESGASMEATNLAVIEYAKQTKAAALETLAADGATRVYIDGHGELQGQLEETTEDTDDLTVANDNLAQKIQDTTDRYKDLKGELSAEEAFHNAEEMWADLQQSAVDAYTAASEHAVDAEQKAFDHAGAVIDAKNKVVELGDKYKELPEEEVTRIVALIDEGKLAEAEAAFNTLTRNRSMSVSIQVAGGSGDFRIVGTGGAPVHKASGGPIPGQKGQPVPIVAHGGEFMLSADVVDAVKHGQPTAGLGGGTSSNGGSPIYVTVNAGLGANGKEIGDIIVNELKKYTRRNGPGWVP